MREAYRHNAHRMWITNIHEPKTVSYQLELFLDMAWDINAIQPSTLNRHLENWLCRDFGEQAGRKMFPAMLTYYRLTAMRRPEFMGWNILSSKVPWGRDGMPIKDSEFNQHEFGNEINRYLGYWQQAREQLAEAERLMPARLKDAFFSHVKYRVLAAAAQSEKMLEAQRARSIARKNYDVSRWTRDTALYTACAKSQQAYQQIRSLTRYWNEDMAGGKWCYSMCDIPRDHKVFYAPVLPVALTDVEVEKYAASPTPKAMPYGKLKD